MEIFPEIGLENLLAVKVLTLNLIIQQDAENQSKVQSLLCTEQ
jgi:hypothetical protein